MTAELAGVLERFGVRGACRIAATPLGTMNETYVVSRAAAPVVLRRHRRLERDVVEREHEVITYVRSRGVPTPVAVRADDGSAVVEHAGRLYSMFEYAVGHQLTPDQLSDGHARSMGVALARCHDALADYPVSRCPSAGIWASPLPPFAETIDRIRTLLTCIKAWPGGGDQESWAVMRLQSRLEWIEPLDAVPGCERTPDAQATHGDFQQANVFFDDSRAVAALIDWDTSKEGCPAVEAVRCMSLALRTHPVLCRAFVDGYRTIRPLAIEALDGAAEIWAAKQLQSLWLYEEVYVEGNDRVRAFIQPGRFVPFTETWSQLRRSFS